MLDLSCVDHFNILPIFIAQFKIVEYKFHHLVATWFK